MKVRIQVIVESDHGETECIEEVAQFERGELRPEALGMTLAEAKALLQSVQQTMVTEQTTAHLEAHRPCPACQAPRRYKGHHQLVYRTVFGRLTRLGRLAFEGVYALSSYAGMTTSSTSSHDLPAANSCLISSSKDRMTSRPIARHFCP
jgi:hypothetical protein